MTKIIGLTGGIGSGKTTVANYFASKGIPVYIADEAAKAIMNDTIVIEEVKAIFPDENVVQNNGFLNRKLIRELVFNNKSKLNLLNKIIHPRVKSDFENWLNKNKKSKFIIKEVAILFETNGQQYCDATILVTAPIETRIKRVLERDKTSRENILQIINNQLPEEEKIKLATYVITNENLNITYKTVDNLIEILKKI